jgi:hypothetical protein
LGDQQQSNVKYILKFSFSSMLLLRPNKLLTAFSPPWNCRLPWGIKDEQPLVDSLPSDWSSPINRKYTKTQNSKAFQNAIITTLTSKNKIKKTVSGFLQSENVMGIITTL